MRSDPYEIVAHAITHAHHERVSPSLFNQNLYAEYAGMHSDNPAVYECPKGKNKLHTWKRNPDLTATCVHCKLSLTRQQADECFEERS